MERYFCVQGADANDTDDPHDPDDPDDPDAASVQVYDLFCGAGGFSTGAVAAGCKVAFACDHSLDALVAHARNHPDTQHAMLSLPDDEAALLAALPTSERSSERGERACWHLHDDAFKMACILSVDAAPFASLDCFKPQAASKVRIL